MTLADLIQELKKSTRHKKSMGEFEKVEDSIRPRIEFPSDFELYDPVKLEDHNHGEGKYLLPHLRVHANAKRSKEEVQPLLDELFLMAKEMRLDHGTGKLIYGVVWTPESFQNQEYIFAIH